MIRKKRVKGNGQVKVTFVLPEDHPYGKIYVVGDFNGWEPKANPFVRRANKTYSTVATVEEGKRYLFRYYCEDGTWVNEEAADDYEPSGFGSDNCVLET